MSLIRHALLVSIILTVIPAQFNIPLPFGGISLNKNKNGELEIGGNQNFNLFGWGANRDFKLTTGNGTFKLDKTDEAILNGSTYGGSGSIGVDEKTGIDIGQNLTLDDKKLVGGLGKEMNFLESLAALFKPAAQPSKERTELKNI
ncbi:uncharacterized protein CELE_F40H3.3 [Caenorhabditis elegans]|uniref:Uncharacterized protein n=1 Tax=Caenorhabditis elegans TaxID=6239 RepID=Q9TZK4_CAEEL|nr:Uncharacterized protein CELE_F40H3.3 [Caenorhabditis elegans]CCD66153.1 Uncharacterized protein CELE_F40H3.3 [Caenorhabditis elegans]|eukprot:NP_495231.1 Uncharacterized protein CELE_F40H3.3 [Caenorhabditis elegans]